MTQQSHISVEEAAHRLGVSTDDVFQYLRSRKLDRVGSGADLLVVWPDPDPAHSLYPNAARDIRGTGDSDFTGGDAHTSGWLIPLIYGLLLVLFLAGGITLFYLLRAPTLPRV